MVDLFWGFITSYPNLSPDRQIYPNLLRPPDLPQPFKKVVRSNPAAQLASTSNPWRRLTGTEATWPPRQKRKEIKSRSVFSLSSRWSLSLSFSLVLHLPSPRSVFFTPIFILSHRSLALANSFSAISISFLVSSQTCSAYAFSAAASLTCSAA